MEMEMNNFQEIINEMGFTGFDLLSDFGSSVISIICYVLMAIGMYTIAKRRGINHPWLAWIPFGSNWLLGCISDQYRYVVNGEEKSKRKWMLALDIITSIGVIVSLVMLVVSLFNVFLNIDSDMQLVMDEEAMMMELLTPMLGSLGILFLMLIPAIILAVMRYMALYDLFASCEPDRKTVYLVLGIFFNIAMAVCVFISRNKDLGMPSRIVATPDTPTWDVPQYDTQPQWQPAEPPAEPWDNN